MMERVSRATIEKGMIPLNKLEKLKLHGTEIGNVALGSILKHCGSKLKTLDIGNTHVGGLGCIQILLVMLGFRVVESLDYKGVNQSLRKLNLSGLSLPQREIGLLSLHLLKFQYLENLNFSSIRSSIQGGGYHELGSGVKSEELTYLMSAISSSASHSTREDVGSTQCNHKDNKHTDEHKGVGCNYSFKSVSLANKVIGRFDLKALCQPCTCTIDEVGWYAIQVSPPKFESLPSRYNAEARIPAPRSQWTRSVEGRSPRD
jgi:hypothetical protein